MSIPVEVPISVERHLRATEMCLRAQCWDQSVVLLASLIERLTWLWLPEGRRAIDRRTVNAWLQRYVVDRGFDHCSTAQLVHLVEIYRKSETSRQSQMKNRPLELFLVYEDAFAHGARLALQQCGLESRAKVVSFRSLLVAVSEGAVACLQDVSRDKPMHDLLAAKAATLRPADDAIVEVIDTLTPLLDLQGS